MDVKFNTILILYFRSTSTIQFSEVNNGDVYLDDIHGIRSIAFASHEL